MRARSLSFMADIRKAGENLRGIVVKEVFPDTRSVKVESLTPSPLPTNFITNWTIGQMTEEIEKGPAWADEFNWALRYSHSVEHPFVVGDGPVVFSTPSTTIAEGWHNSQSLLFFPLCWQACLIGSREDFEVETGQFVEEDLRKVRRIYRDTTQFFLVSPQRLNDL